MTSLMDKVKARNCFDKAERSYEEATRFIDERKYAQGVDKVYDFIENSLKALLNLYGISYKPTHDITNVLPKIVDNIPSDHPSYYVYSEDILPPLIAIHKILRETRNMARYGYEGIPPGRIFNESIAKSLQMMVETNYPSLKGWITELLCKKEDSQ